MRDLKAYNRAYYLANCEHIKAQAAEYRNSNPEKAKEAVLHWYASEEGKAKRRKYFKTYAKTEMFKRAAANYRAKNPEKIKNRGRNWRLENPHLNAAKETHRRASKLKRTPSWLSEDDLWIMKEIYKLSSLRSELTGVPHHVDHIIPLQGKLVSGLHVPLNLQVIPAVENLKKNSSYCTGG